MDIFLWFERQFTGEKLYASMRQFLIRTSLPVGLPQTTAVTQLNQKNDVWPQINQQLCYPQTFSPTAMHTDKGDWYYAVLKFNFLRHIHIVINCFIKGELGRSIINREHYRQTSSKFTIRLTPNTESISGFEKNQFILVPWFNYSWICEIGWEFWV